MATGHDRNPAPSPETIDAGYEMSTVSIKGLAIFLVCLIVSAALIHLGVWILFERFVKHDQRMERPRSALGTTIVLPPSPRLQPTPGLQNQNVPAADLEEMYQKEDSIFARMGWTIEGGSHTQAAIPSSAISTVMADESARRALETATTTQPAKNPK